MSELLKSRKPLRLLTGLGLILGLGLTGCKTQTTPLANGYERVTHPIHADFGEPQPARISFQYREASGKTIQIWPALYGVAEVINGDVAVFVGDKAYVEADGKVTHPRLFAVKAPELPVDITDEVLWIWSKSTGKDFSTAMNQISLVTPEKKGDRLELHLDFWTGGSLLDFKSWPDKSDLQLNWQQVANILHGMKSKGVLERDLRWHTPYIGLQN